MAERFQAALGQISTEMPSIEEAIFADLDSALTGEIGSGDPVKEQAKLETLEKQLEEQLKVSLMRRLISRNFDALCPSANGKNVMNELSQIRRRKKDGNELADVIVTK